MDFRISNSIKLLIYKSTCIEHFCENVQVPQNWKISWGSSKVLPNKVSKRSSCMFEDIDLGGLYTKLYKKPSETLGADLISRLEISNYCLSWSFNQDLLHFAQSSLIEMKSIFTQLQNKPSPKAIDQEVSVINNMA